jgi:hypothetical protein
MSEKAYWKKCVGAVLLALLIFPVIVHRVGSESTTVSVEPQSIKVWGVDESFTVNIKVAEISSLSPLYGWQIKLYYNPNVINGTGIAEGSFLKTQGETFFNFNQTEGQIAAFGTLKGNVSGASGSGILLTIAFKAKAIGISVLDLEETILGDMYGKPLNHTVMDGAVQVVPPVYDAAIESLTATPNKVVNGQTVDIHVIAANRGNRTETFNVTIYCNETVIDAHTVNNLPPGNTTALAFVWNTTGVTPNATCVIKAEASAVPEETNLANNYRDLVIEVVQGIHDIAVASVFCSPQFTYKGRIVNIYVVVKNEGNYTETFNLTVYRNETAVERKTVRLQYGATEYITFAWNTTDAETNATYLLKAVAAPLPGEKDYYNNNCTDGYITVYPPGLIKIEIVELTPCNDLGSATSVFKAGTTAYFKITVQSTSVEAEQILLTINLFDSRGVTFGVVSFKGPIGPEATTFMPGFPIPKTASLGTAIVRVSVLTDWVHLGGVPYCADEATFEVIGS